MVYIRKAELFAELSLDGCLKVLDVGSGLHAAQDNPCAWAWARACIDFAQSDLHCQHGAALVQAAGSGRVASAPV